jgi:hypothetical protein
MIALHIGLTNVMHRNVIRSFLLALPALPLMICLGCASAPTGAYYDKYVGSIEPTYWVFKDGDVYWRTRGAPDEFVGPYFKLGNEWVLRSTEENGNVTLRTKLFGIRMISSSKPYLNRYLPRRGFAWLNSGRAYNLPPESR